MLSRATSHAPPVCGAAAEATEAGQSLEPSSSTWILSCIFWASVDLYSRVGVVPTGAVCDPNSKPVVQSRDLTSCSVQSTSIQLYYCSPWFSDEHGLPVRTQCFKES